VVVVVMGAALRYAALSRFFLAAGAVLCVIGAVGLVRLVRAVPRGRWRVAATAALALFGLVFAGPRVIGLEAVVDDVADRHAIEDDLLAVVDDAGREAVLACGPVVADPADLPQAALAWDLDVPFTDVRPRPGADRSFVAVVGIGGRLDRRLERGAVPPQPVATGERWRIVAVGCPDAVPR
jgi:hypothetical protein